MPQIIADEKVIKYSEKRDFNTPKETRKFLKFFSKHQGLSLFLNNFETLAIKRKIKNIDIVKPIYIVGFIRSGTTITIDMLSQHPDVAAHRHYNVVNPYIPYWIKKIADRMNTFNTPVERMQKDRIYVTKETALAVEEVFWLKFFGEKAKNQYISNVLDSNTDNPKFETFYKTHLKKLMISQNATRYAAKSNYSITRLEYIQKILPDARFLLYIRDPFTHISSLIRQDKIFTEVHEKNPELLLLTKVLGHRNFGPTKSPLNFNDTVTVRKIEELWSNEDTYVEGWALYWRKLYTYIYDLMQKNEKLRKAITIVRYEDLCEKSGETIDRILDHTSLDPVKFEKAKKEYEQKLTLPKYYKTVFTEEEKEAIHRQTDEIAKKFGY